MIHFNALWCAERASKIIDRRPAMPAPKIITSHNRPYFDRVSAWAHADLNWSAHFQGWADGPYGYGPTEAEAIRDLTENYDNPDQE